MSISNISNTTNKMGKVLLTAWLSMLICIVCHNANAQKGFFDLNVSYNKFTQYFEKPVGSILTDIDDDVQTYNINTPSLDTDSISLLNINLGYNFHLDNGCYLGFYLGYSKMKGFQLGNTATMFTFSPHITYMIHLNKHFIYTPNCYVSIGYGTTKMGVVSISVGPLSQPFDLGNIKKINLRFGISPFSFDYKLSEAASVNLALLTPMLNIMKYSYATEDFNQTTKDVVFLYGQVGFKLYLNKKNTDLQNNKNKKHKR